MPPDVPHLKTDVLFPVSYGTGVSVSCSEDRELRGDKVITCNQATEFQFKDKPKCNSVGKYTFVNCVPKRLQLQLRTRVMATVI